MYYHQFLIASTFLYGGSQECFHFNLFIELSKPAIIDCNLLGFKLILTSDIFESALFALELRWTLNQNNRVEGNEEFEVLIFVTHIK